MSNTNNTNADTNKRSESIANEKKKLIDTMSKEELVDFIFKQSDQISEFADMANTIESNARSDESKKCNVNKINNNILNLQKQQIDIYDRSFRTQFMLFTLYIVMIIWLLYHYVTSIKIE
jgi:predicted HAD superfamily Cof-like phosphohydrolase